MRRDADSGKALLFLMRLAFAAGVVMWLLIIAAVALGVRRLWLNT